MPLRTPEPIDGAALHALLAVGRRAGLDHIGIAPADVLRRARAALLERRAAGLHDTMQFTYRNPERSTDPSSSVAGARSMIVAARSYVMDEPETPDTPYGAVARYAWIDHYAPLRAGLREVANTLRAAGHKAVVIADENSMVDREAAWLAGLGWFGKNANLLVPGAGSYFVLGSVITSAVLPPAAAPVEDGCGPCRRCLDNCPTGAIVADGVVDAARCLAWLLQRPGVFPREHRVALGNRIYGCDSCQTVCPPTVRFERRVTTRAASAEPAQAWVPLLRLLELDDATLLAEHGRFYLADRNPMWLRRNALIALGNSASSAHVHGNDFCGAHEHGEHVRLVLRRYLEHAEPMLRAHAVWAAAQLGLLAMLPAHDNDPLVLDELAAARA